MKDQLRKISDTYHNRTQAIYAALLVYFGAKNAIADGNNEIAKRIDELNKYLSGINITSDQYFNNLVFVQLIAEIELNFVAIFKIVFLAYPEKLGSATFKLSEILESQSSDELVERAASIYLNKIMYEKPMDYLKEMSKVLSFDVSLLKKEWAIYIESKARRDTGIHDDWTVNETYLRKISEAGFDVAKLRLGDKLYPDVDYIIGTMSNSDDMIEKIIDHCTNKFQIKKSEV